MKDNKHVISVEETYYLKFLRDGLITWEEKDESYLNNVSASRDKILSKSHTRISNLFSLDPMFTTFLKVYSQFSCKSLLSKTRIYTRKFNQIYHCFKRQYHSLQRKHMAFSKHQHYWYPTCSSFSKLFPFTCPSQR